MTLDSYIDLTRQEPFTLGPLAGQTASREVVVAGERELIEPRVMQVLVALARRAGDVEQVWADTRFANDVLGWKAESTLEETILSAWNWEKHYRSKK